VGTYGEGKRLKKDLSQARFYYTKGCDLKEFNSCFNMGLIYFDGKGVEINTNKAMQYFGKACDYGSSRGCRNYAILYKLNR
jgi:TPR repeat protein